MNAIRLAFVLALLIGSPLVFACSCAGRSGVAEATEAADLVFVGTVQEVDGRWFPVKLAWLYVRSWFGNEPDYDEMKYGYEVTFRATTFWKGPATRTAKIITGRGHGDCGYRFLVGKTYLVYAYSRNGRYGTNICTRTALASDAANDLRYLGGE